MSSKEATNTESHWPLFHLSFLLGHERDQFKQLLDLSDAVPAEIMDDMTRHYLIPSKFYIVLFAVIAVAFCLH